MYQAVEVSHFLVSQTLQYGETAVDATAGNGHDTLKLARLVGQKGRVYAFDIQQNAVDKTACLLVDNGMRSRVELIRDGHEKMEQYVESGVGAVMFNLGYLPGGDHELITSPSTTVTAVYKALDILRRGGVITIVSYTSHEGGGKERDALLGELTHLSQREYQVVHYAFVNQINNPPELFAVEKL